MLKHLITNEENLITKDELTDVFYSGCKTESEVKKIGVEFEKLPVCKNTFKAAPYADVAAFLCRYKNSLSLGKWSGVYENGAILGLSCEKGTISLEPGSQTEISLAPIEKISDIKRILDVYNKSSNEIAQQLGIYWLGYGIQPVSTYKNMRIIPKKRYEYMTKYLPTVAKKPLVMMRETSGIQASFDYTSESDAMKKFQTALKLSPLMSAAFANSPVRNGRLTKYKSDWELHLSLYFPDVRLKNYIEIRNHDNQRSPLIPSVPAFWKGIIYNDSAIDAVNEVLGDLSYFEFEYLRQKTPKTGLDIRIKKYSLKDLVKEIVSISYNSLKSAKNGEEVYLEPLMELVSQGLTPADVIISKWENEWKRDVSKLVEYSRFV